MNCSFNLTTTIMDGLIYFGWPQFGVFRENPYDGR